MPNAHGKVPCQAGKLVVPFRGFVFHDLEDALEERRALRQRRFQIFQVFADVLPLGGSPVLFGQAVRQEILPT